MRYHKTVILRDVKMHMKISAVGLRALLSALLLPVILLVGCVSVPLATPADDAKAKLFEPVNTKAVIYIYRTVAFAGGGTSVSLMVDGKEIKLSSGSFVRLEKEPGKVELSATRRDWFGFESGIRVFPFMVKMGDIIFIKVYLPQAPFAVPGLRFEEVGLPTGRTAVRELDLIDTGTH